MFHNSFHPGYLTAERLAKAKKLKIAITAGIGSDHVDLNAANKTNGGITVAEVTGSNVVSVAEHVLMTILVLVRNFVPAHEQIQAGEWNVAAAAKNEYDLEGKVVGTVAVGRIGERVLRRLKPFDCKELLYYDYQPLKPEVEKEIGCRRVESLEEMLGQCDVVTINCPLHEKTRGLFNKELISKMKKGKSHHAGNVLIFRYSNKLQVHGSSTQHVVLSSSRKMLQRRSSPVTSTATVVMFGSHSQRPRSTHFATQRTPWAVETPWCRI
jgi:hypothetical protein